MIGVVNYGMGNIKSVYNAFYYLGEEVKICQKKNDFNGISKLIIPGVGAFEEAINIINNSDLHILIKEYVENKKIPTLGICLGMQLMAKKSHENGIYEGLNFFDAEVIKIPIKNKTIPNIGWNEIEFDRNDILFNGIKNFSDFYFVHSYFMKCNNNNDISSTYHYDGSIITASVKKENIFATQFHPEKSQESGIRLLENFINWNP